MPQNRNEKVRTNLNYIETMKTKDEKSQADGFNHNDHTRRVNNGGNGGNGSDTNMKINNEGRSLNQTMQKGFESRYGSKMADVVTGGLGAAFNIGENYKKAAGALQTAQVSNSEEAITQASKELGNVDLRQYKKTLGETRDALIGLQQTNEGAFSNLTAQFVGDQYKNLQKTMKGDFTKEISAISKLQQTAATLNTEKGERMVAMQNLSESFADTSTKWYQMAHFDDRDIKVLGKQLGDISKSYERQGIAIHGAENTEAVNKYVQEKLAKDTGYQDLYSKFSTQKEITERAASIEHGFKLAGMIGSDISAAGHALSKLGFSVGGMRHGKRRGS